MSDTGHHFRHRDSRRRTALATRSRSSGGPTSKDSPDLPASLLAELATIDPRKLLPEVDPGRARQRPGHPHGQRASPGSKASGRSR